MERKGRAKHGPRAYLFRHHARTGPPSAGNWSSLDSIVAQIVNALSLSLPFPPCCACSTCQVAGGVSLNLQWNATQCVCVYWFLGLRVTDSSQEASTLDQILTLSQINSTFLPKVRTAWCPREGRRRKLNGQWQIWTPTSSRPPSNRSGLAPSPLPHP